MLFFDLEYCSGVGSNRTLLGALVQIFWLGVALVSELQLSLNNAGHINFSNFV